MGLNTKESSYTNTEALKLLVKGKKLTKVAWGCLAYIYMDSFGKIRVSDGYEEYNWNNGIQSDNTKRWIAFNE